MAFIQIIEFRTARADEIEAVLQEWQSETAGRRSAQRATFTQDRDSPSTYL